MPRRDAKALDRPKMGRRNPGNAPLRLSARDEQALRYGRGGQADDTRWLPEAAAGAMQAVGTDRIARAAFGLAAKALGRAAPVFRPVPAKAGGVHVPRSAATARDAEALALYDRLLDGERFGSLPREAQLDVARRTGWQELPTGETVRQIPRFEFGPGWRRYEPFATETRAVLSGVAENEVGAVPPMTMAEAFAGDGAKELFRRYPNARNWLVRADRAPASRVMGFSEPGSTAVTVTDEGLMRGAEPVLNTVHHETQHVIQNMSGMSPGSTSADALAELKTGIGNAMLDGRGSDPNVVHALDVLQWSMRTSDPAYYAYQHAGGEAGAFAAGNAAVEGRAGELIADAMSREGIVPENVYDLRALRQDNKGGNAGKFKGWKAYKDTKEAAAAEAAAVAFVNEGIVDAPPLSEGDLEDSRRSAAWLEANGERKGLVKEGTLSHTGRPRFVSRNGFMEGDTYFQGDRFSSTVPVDPDAQHKDPDGYARTGQWAVIPTVYPDVDGVTRLHTGVDAESAYRKGGGHFGVYEGLDNANHGAEWDHHKGNAEWARRSEVRQDAKGGEDRFSMSRNFLATDKVPDTIFGIPVVSRREDYTEADIRFFQEHPEAGGYYDLGEDADDAGASAAMWGGVPRAPTVKELEDFADLAITRSNKVSEQLSAARRGVVSTLNRNTGVRVHSTALGKMADYGLARASEWNARSTTNAQKFRDEGRATPGLGGMVQQAIGTVAATAGSYAQPLLGGARQLAATWLSDGGKNYVPEPNTEKMFSRDALQELSNARSRSGGKGIVSSRAYGEDGSLFGVVSDPARFEAEAPTGSMSERNGALVDVADMNINYQGEDAPYQRNLGLVGRALAATANNVGNAFAAAAGASDDLDAGKIKTVIPVDKLPAPKNPSSAGDVAAALKRSAKAFEDFDKDERRTAQISTRQDSRGGDARGKYPGSLNNPGNVEKRRTRRAGEVDSPHARWAKFDTPQNGLAASAAVVREIAESKLAAERKPFTIRNYAEKYAPRSENDTDAYVRNLSKYSGIGADDVLDLWDTDAMSRLLRAKVRFESGVPHSQWFTDDEYRAAAEAMKEGAVD